MININEVGFVEKFKISDANVGIIGHGFVGKAMDEFFNGKCTVRVYDKKDGNAWQLESVIDNSEVIFICVNTPMKADGSCHTGFVTEVIRDIHSRVMKTHRDPSSLVLVIKSTVKPGYTKEVQQAFAPLRVCFSPEFLTEKNSVQDMKETNRIIVGGEKSDALIVCKYFADADPEPLKSIAMHIDPQRVIVQCDSTTAELVKLYANGMLAAKVMFSNEIYQICKSMTVSYDDVRSLACLDERIGSGHTQVPGPDGDLGFGGHCFPKDVNSLKALCAELGIQEKMITAILERNDSLRTNKNWLEMKGRAVI